MVSLIMCHGAWSSKKAFNHITEILKRDGYTGNILHYEYCCQTESITSITHRLEEEIKSIKDEVVIVGHSLGGLFALSVAHLPNISDVITMASPVAGIKINPFMRSLMTWHAPFIRELVPEARFMRNIHEKNYEVPIELLITTTGYIPLLVENNDGVITIESQTNWKPKDARTKLCDANHHEILQSMDAMDSIKQALK